MRVAAVAVLSTLLASGAAYAEPYVNARYGTALDVPTQVFSRRLPPPDNGDGQSWQASDGAKLFVFGSYNALDDTPASFFQELVTTRRASTELTYSHQAGKVAVVSGFAGSTVYYEKYLFGARNEIVHGFILSYPKSAKAKYDPLVGPIAKSLTGP